MGYFINYTLPKDTTNKKFEIPTTILQGPLDSITNTTSKIVAMPQATVVPTLSAELNWRFVSAAPTTLSPKVSITETLNQDNSNYTGLAKVFRDAADYAKAHAHKTSNGWCARYVSNALEASGIKNFKGFERKNGWEYDKVAQNLGMQDVTEELTFKKGDLAVTKTTNGRGHVTICNRDGATINDRDAWSADFTSRAFPYRNLNTIKYAKVFRAPNGPDKVNSSKYGGILALNKNVLNYEYFK